MGFYTHKKDKKSGDGLALTEWNDLSNAVAGNSGLTLALNADDKVNIGTIDANTRAKLTIKTDANNTNGITQTDGKVSLSTFVDSNGAAIGTLSKDVLCLFANGKSASITIDVKGNVAIGNDYDMKRFKASLDVKGNITVGGDITTTTGRIIAKTFNGDGSGLINIGKDGMTLATESGGVSIGTYDTDPSAKLIVDGNVKVSGGEIDGKIWYSKEYEWKDSGPDIKMGPVATTVAFLTYVETTGHVHIDARSDGYWYLMGNNGTARARCIGKSY